MKKHDYLGNQLCWAIREKAAGDAVWVGTRRVVKGLAVPAKKLRHADPIFSNNILLISKLALLQPPRRRKCLGHLRSGKSFVGTCLHGLSIRYPDTLS